MKKKDIVIREYVRSLNEEDLKFVASRLSFIYGRRGGDVAEVLQFLQKSAEVAAVAQEVKDPTMVDFLRASAELDRVFSGSRDHGHLFDLVDDLGEAAEREIKRRITLQREGTAESA